MILASSTVAGILALLGTLIAGCFVLAAFVFWIWMLIDAITNKGLTDTEKLIWVVVIIFVHFIGALIYFFVGRPKGRTATG
jgi:hypothetical protein